MVAALVRIGEKRGNDVNVVSDAADAVAEKHRADRLALMIRHGYNDGVLRNERRHHVRTD